MNYLDINICSQKNKIFKSKRKSEITIKELVIKRQEKIRNHTQKVDLSLIKHLETFANKEISVKSINADFCFAFAKYLTSKAKVKISSATTYIQKLHAVLQEAVYLGYIKSNPMPPINRLLPKQILPQRPNLSVKEVEALNDSECPHLITKLAFLFSCYTGLRLSDIETLKWNNIQKHNGIYMLVKIQVKTNSEVCIPLCKQAIQILRQVQDKNISTDENIFPMYSRTTICSDLRQWVTNAGIDKHITFHISRITFVTLSISAGMNMYVISKLCGHKDIKTTQIYARMIDSTYINAITMFENIFKHKKTKQKSIQKVELLL